ncbi:MAG: dihydroorotase [Lachnospiraceae bacterium]|nr:dihydroorotase [Lachnospiraceae bacterium]
MRLLIKNGRVLDPASEKDGICDVLIADGRIEKVAEHIEDTADQVIDASGCFVMPGLIDLHVHLRDPGLTYKEDIETGAKAAARGGFTTILAMPNTKPVIDTPDRIAFVREKAKRVAPIHVLQIGAVTMGQKGEVLADIAGMVKAGCPAISEDGKSVMNSQLYREAMDIAAELDIPVMAHCEDISLVNHGVMNADDVSERMGMPGIPNAAEDVITARDILLAKETGARLHLCHCSTKDSMKMIRWAKEEGIKVSAEVCPHHFTLISSDIKKDDSNFKMNPPLRTGADRAALLEALKDGTIDAISTDHAPHSAEEKNQSIRKAPFGIVGLETAVGLTITRLVEQEIITPLQMARLMSFQPAGIAGLDKGTLGEGKPADVVIIDPKEEYVIDKNTFASKGKNTPFDGWKVRGKVKMTICDGRVVYRDTVEQPLLGRRDGGKL